MSVRSSPPKSTLYAFSHKPRFSVKGKHTIWSCMHNIQLRDVTWYDSAFCSARNYMNKSIPWCILYPCTYYTCYTAHSYSYHKNMYFFIDDMNQFNSISLQLLLPWMIFPVMLLHGADHNTPRLQCGRKSMALIRLIILLQPTLTLAING